MLQEAVYHVILRNIKLNVKMCQLCSSKLQIIYQSKNCLTASFVNDNYLLQYKTYLFFLQLFFFGQIWQYNAQTYHWVKIIIVVNLFKKITMKIFQCVKQI